MKIEQMKIKDIIPYERNAKKHDNNQINNVAESIQRFGFAQPLVVDKDNVLIIGHCRLLAAKRLKLREVPVVKMTELTEEQVKQLRLLDNKLNESEWDLDLLMSEIEGLDFEGFNIDWEIPELEETLEVIEDEAPEPELEKEPITKPGDIYKLGKHRLICGDSTNPETIKKLWTEKDGPAHHGSALQCRIRRKDTGPTQDPERPLHKRGRFQAFSIGRIRSS